MDNGAQAIESAIESGQVTTVAGPIPVDELGVPRMHEHIVVDATGLFGVAGLCAPVAPDARLDHARHGVGAASHAVAWRCRAPRSDVAAGGLNPGKRGIGCRKHVSS